MRIDKISKLGIPFMVVGACATGGALGDRGSVASESVLHGPAGSERSTVRLSLVAPPDRSPASRGGFPAVDDPQLPTADLQFHRIWDEVGDTASADIRLCVASDGHVSSVRLVRGSSSVTYNRALVNDAADWRFAAAASPPGPGQRCEIANVVYLPHA